MNSNKLYMNVKDVKQIINIINQNIRYWSNNLIFIIPPHDSASVLACAYQLKVRSKNSKNFEYWLCRWL